MEGLNVTKYRTPSPSTEVNQQLAEDLNELYCRFETPHTRPDHLSTQPLIPPATPISRTSDQRRRCAPGLQEEQKKKGTRPICVTPACLKTCADQLAPIFTQIFNRSLELCEVPSCFKHSTTIPVPKKPKITGINYYRPVALTSVVMKSFEKTGSGLSEGHHWTLTGPPAVCLPSKQLSA